MERRGRRTGAARWDGSSSSSQNLTLLVGVTDNTEEDWRGRGRGATSENLPLEWQAITATETRLRRRRGRQKLEKGIEGGRQGGVFVKNVKGRGQFCLNDEQFAFPLLVYNQILYHIFLCQP
jgi:hypothetical protein